jgi:alkylhydroperoxidase family enzyme
MARLDYPPIDTPDAQRVAEEVKRLRGGRLLNLYRMQLYNPDITSGWLQLGTAIRFGSSLDGASRELAICMVARLTGAEYEWRGHSRVALQEGISQAQLDSLPDAWQAGEVFDARQRAVLAAAQELTRQVHMQETTAEALRSHLTPREVVEVVATVAYYNMCARFLEGLEIDMDE